MTRHKEILANPALTRSALRRYSKEDLITALLQLRKRHAEIDAGELKRQEIELETLKARLAGSQNIGEAVLKYSDMVGNHQYGPMAVKSLSAAMSSVLTPAIQDDSDPIPDEIQTRIDVALGQGMKWNKNNRKPDRIKAIMRRLQEWEASIESGRQADPANFLPLGYQKLIKEHGGEGFVVGLCERAEADLNITPKSSYLKVRFRGLAANYKPQPPSNPLSLAIEVVDRFFGGKVPEPDLSKKAKTISRWLNHYSSNLRNMDMEGLRDLVCPRYSPDFFPYTKDRPNANGTDKYQSIVNYKKYDPELQQFWAAYCDEKGW